MQYPSEGSLGESEYEEGLYGGHRLSANATVSFTAEEYSSSSAIYYDEENSDELYGKKPLWDLTGDLKPDEHVLTIEVIPQNDFKSQRVIFFTDQNNSYTQQIFECKKDAKLRSIQADDGFELCDIQWKDGTVYAVQKPIIPSEYIPSASVSKKIQNSDHAQEETFASLPPPELSPKFQAKQSSMYKGRLGDVGACSTFWEPGIVMSGYFDKRGGGKYSSDWRRRFAVLNSAREILYYEDDKCEVAKGELHIPATAQIGLEGDYELLIICKDRTWHFRYASKEIRDEWVTSIQTVMKNDDEWGFCTARGLLQKKGKRLGGWMARYVKLYDNKVMKYLNDEHCSLLTGETSLAGMTKVSYTEGGKGKGDEWKYGFIIEERNRQRHFRVRTQEERIMWISSLSKYIEHI